VPQQGPLTLPKLRTGREGATQGRYDEPLSAAAGTAPAGGDIDSSATKTGIPRKLVTIRVTIQPVIAPIALLAYGRWRGKNGNIRSLTLKRVGPACGEWPGKADILVGQNGVASAQIPPGDNGCITSSFGPFRGKRRRRRMVRSAGGSRPMVGKKARRLRAGKLP